MTERDIRLLCAILFAVIVAFAQIVSADDAEALTLAQAAVAEASLAAHDDHAAIWHVLQRRAAQRGVTISTMAGLYVSILRKRAGEYVVQTPRAQWIRGLTLDGAQPVAWPASQSWKHNAPRWLAVVERAREFVAGRVVNPCEGASHFGGDMDTAWRGLERVECSAHTLNTFYRTVTR